MNNIFRTEETTLYTFSPLEDLRKALVTGGAQDLEPENLSRNPIFTIFWEVIEPLFYDSPN